MRLRNDTPVPVTIFLAIFSSVFSWGIDREFTSRWSIAPANASLEKIELDARTQPFFCEYYLGQINGVYPLMDSFRSGSESSWPIDTFQLDEKQSELLKRQFGSDAQPLTDLLLEGRDLSDANSQANLKERISKLPKERFVEFGDFEVSDGPPTSFSEYLSRLAFKIPWNSVRLKLPHETQISGYFLPIAWNPVTKQLFVSPGDFTYTDLDANAACHFYNLIPVVPLGRGLPTDQRTTRANCGPMALSAFLNKSSEETMSLLDQYHVRGYLGMQEAVRALKKVGLEYQNVVVKDKTSSLREALGGHNQGLVLIRFLKEDGSEGPRPFWGHWVAYDRGFVYDMNVSPVGGWIPENLWQAQFIPRLHPRGTNKFYVRNAIVPKGEPEIHPILPLNEALIPIMLSGQRHTTVRMGKRENLTGKALFFNELNNIYFPIFITQTEYTTLRHIPRFVLDDQGLSIWEEMWQVLLGYYPNITADSVITIYHFDLK